MSINMIHKVVYNIARRAIAHSRYLDKESRKLFLVPCTENVYSSRNFSRICSYPGLYWNVNNRDKYSPRVGTKPRYCPQIIPALSYSLEQQEKSKTIINQDEGLKKGDSATNIQDEDEKNLSIFKRFKKMYRDYWYVLVPVHVITSLGWFGGFYYLAISGVDIISIAEMLGVSNHVPEILKDSKAGYFAVSYALYKIATPMRYMVTIGGTTISINYLKDYGYIKPIPPKSRLKEMYQEQKENLKERRLHFADEFKQKKEQLKERSQTLKERGQTLMRERRQQTQK